MRSRIVNSVEYVRPRSTLARRVATVRCSRGGSRSGSPGNLALSLPVVQRRLWVDTSSSPDGEAAVHRRPTRERQVTNTLLPDCAIKPPAAEADEEPPSVQIWGLTLLPNGGADLGA